MMLALIGGTGLSELTGLVVERSHAVDTPYGQPSDLISEGTLDGNRLLFLHRHGGAQGSIPPHRVNYRANVWALRELGATKIVAANAVGAINPELDSNALVIPDQLIDYTWGREHTFDDGSSGELLHVDFTEPFDRTVRAELIAAATAASVAFIEKAVVGVVQGPRLETAAEIQRLARDGCELVGMTSLPEAGLARELGVPYASVCMVVNAAAGIGEGPISMDVIRANLSSNTRLLAALLKRLL